MQTLSYGFLKPQTGDKGSVFFPALETTIQLLNDHTHDGSNSAKLPASSLTLVTQSISHLNWSATSGGTYRQAVTVPAGFNYDSTTVSFRKTTGDLLTLSIEKIDSSSYYVYINDNTLDLIAAYGL